MNTRLNFLYIINNIHYSLSPGHGLWFFFRQKERHSEKFHKIN